MKKIVRTMVPMLLAGSSAQAALVDRGGGMIYDDVLNITWVQDANYAQTSGYDADGGMSFGDGRIWAANLDYGGYKDWRLPTIVDTGSLGCDLAYSGTDCGHNVQTKDGTTVYSELAHLWYVTLGNKAYYDSTGGFPQPAWGFNNKGPFINAQSYAYLSGTAYAPVPSLPWVFDTYDGFQGYGDLGDSFFAWAVRDGDVASTVPLPATAWLLLSGLGGLGLVARSKRRLS